MEFNFPKIVKKCRGCDILSIEDVGTCGMCYTNFCKDCKYVCRKCEDCKLVMCGVCWNKKTIFENVNNKVYLEDIKNVNTSFTKCGRCILKYPKDLTFSEKYDNYKSIYEILAIRMNDKPEKKEMKKKLLDFFNVYKQNFTILQEAEESFMMTLKDLSSF